MVPDISLPSTTDRLHDRLRGHDRVTGYLSGIAARYGLFAYALGLALAAVAGPPALVVVADVDAAVAAHATFAAVTVGYLLCVGLLFRDRMPL
jgi:hypothetical protein